MKVGYFCVRRDMALILGAVLVLAAIPFRVASLSTDSGVAHATTTGDGIKDEHVAGGILVKFKAGLGLNQIAEINESYGVLPARDAVVRLDGKTAGVPSLKASSIPRIDVYSLKIPKGRTVPEMVELYNGHPDVEYAEPNYVAHAAMTPNDPGWGQQWGPAKIRCPEAWDMFTGNDDVVVAVIDTGVDYNHPDLAGKVIKGYDFCNNDDDPMDDNGHGTFCSGIAAATGNNGVGIAGVTWGAKVLAVKFLDSSGAGSYENAAAAIIYAVDHGAHVLNNSWGGSGDSQTVHDAVDYAWNNGVLFVASAGSGGGPVDYPALYANAMAISATDSNDNIATFSNRGDKIEVAAPGVDIYSLYLSGGYKTMSGTSWACAHVAGLAGLIMSYNRDKTAAEVRQIICDSAEDLGDPGRDPDFGFGRIDAYKALVQTGPAQPTVTPTPTVTPVPVVALAPNKTVVETGDSLVMNLAINERISGMGNLVMYVLVRTPQGGWYSFVSDGSRFNIKRGIKPSMSGAVIPSLNMPVLNQKIGGSLARGDYWFVSAVFHVGDPISPADWRDKAIYSSEATVTVG